MLEYEVSAIWGILLRLMTRSRAATTCQMLYSVPSEEQVGGRTRTESRRDGADQIMRKHSVGRSRIERRRFVVGLVRVFQDDLLVLTFVAPYRQDLHRCAHGQQGVSGVAVLDETV